MYLQANTSNKADKLGIWSSLSQKFLYDVQNTENDNTFDTDGKDKTL